MIAIRFQKLHINIQFTVYVACQNADDNNMEVL